MPADRVPAVAATGGTAVTFSVRLDAASAAALEALCARLRCRRAEAVRHALLEAAATGEVLARLERIEALLRASGRGGEAAPPAAAPAASLPPPDTAAAATLRNLAGWAGPE